MGFQCANRHRNDALTVAQWVLSGMQHSLQTIIVLSPEFLQSTWPYCEVKLNQVPIIII